MKLQTVVIRCTKCAADFEGKIAVECSIKVFDAVLKDMKCPTCGAGYKTLALVKTKDIDE